MDIRGLLRKAGLIESIRSRIVIYFILLIIVPSIFIGYMAYKSEKAALEERIKGQLTSIADVLKNRVTSWLKESTSEAVFIAGDERVVKNLGVFETASGPSVYKDTVRYKEVAAVLDSIKKNHNYLDIFILDTKGRVLVTTVEQELGDDRSGEKYFSGGLKAGMGGDYFQDVYFDTHYKKVAMALAVPVSVPERSTGKVAGVAVLILGMEESLYPIVEDIPGMGSTAETLIGRREGGEVVYISRLKKKQAAPLMLRFPVGSAPQPILYATAGREGIFVASDYQDVRVLAACRYIPETGWGLVVKEDYDAAFMPVKMLGMRVLITMGFEFLMIFMLIYMVTTRITNPIVTLNELAKRITKGDFSAGLPVKRKDELGGLAASFNEMANALMKYRHEVEEKNAALGSANEQLVSLAEKLEVKVAARTAELEESKDRLSESLETVERANVELRRMDRIKDHFLGMMSHELRTPLSLITGYTSNLLADPAFRADPRAEESIEGIYKGAERLKSIINEMMDISQIDAKGLRLVFSNLRIGALVEDVLKDLESFINERNHKVVVGDFSVVPEIPVDTKRIRQVLVNIIGNAIKFTPDGGRIEITPKYHAAGSEYVMLHSGMDGDYVDIVVKDGGIGIDKDETDRIFEKFYEVGDIGKHATSKFRFLGRGVGLGLPIARGIVEAHGGRLWVESEGYDPLKLPGSSFHILLPVGREAGKRAMVGKFGEPLDTEPPK